MAKIKPVVTIVRAGRLGYQAGLSLQQHLAEQRSEEVANFRNYLILQEHDPVYTIGIRTKSYSLADETKLRELGAEFYRTNRGGLITFHGPGQLVAYPILHLRQFQPSMRWYVGKLEEAVIETCKILGIRNATTTPDTGIWVGDNKICAIGLHGSRFVTTHGIGLNCCTDLKWFEHIVPCGIEGKGVTSLSKELQRHVTVEEGAAAFVKSLAKTLDCHLIEATNTKDLLRNIKHSL